MGLWILAASSALYFVADSIFKQRATKQQIAEQFDKAQYSILNFLLDIPALLVGTYDRLIVPLLNLFSALTLAVMLTILRPLEVCAAPICAIYFSDSVQEAWGCYQSDDIAGLEYGTCPEFGAVNVNNVSCFSVSPLSGKLTLLSQVDVSGNICSRPQATINCVTRPSAFSDERTARHVAFVALALSVMFYAANLSNRMLYAEKILLEDR